jgi:hypothetical protein
MLRDTWDTYDPCESICTTDLACAYCGEDVLLDMDSDTYFCCGCGKTTRYSGDIDYSYAESTERPTTYDPF